VDTARARLATLLRLAAPDIVRALAEEAARSVSSETSSVRSSPDEYETWIARLLPRALDAVGAEDGERAQLLASLAQESGASVRVVPPVARVGLLSIGLRLARGHVERTLAGQPEAAAILREFDLFAAALRASVVPMSARS